MNNKIESDPNGFDQHTPGAKLDAGKLRAGLVLDGFSLALQEVCKIGTYGANKYTDNGWRQVPDGQKRYHDAMYRHLLEHAKHESDEESGFPHLAHAAWNILALLELKMLEKNSVPVQAVENLRREVARIDRQARDEAHREDDDWEAWWPQLPADEHF